MALSYVHLPLLLLLLPLSEGATVFTLHNNCKTKVWLGILSGAGSDTLNHGGLRLKPSDTVNVTAPEKWSGRFWGRHGCTFNRRTGQGHCVTGDCGGLMHCSGAGGAPPVSLAEFTLNSPVDYYDVSLVDGYNLPISVVPIGGSGSMCKPVTCVSDLNRSCPQDLQVKVNNRVVACKSACLAFNTPEYCCTGAYGTPDKCKPSEYSHVFKAACPSAYSYAYDDATSTFVCDRANYLIRFC
ncbi:hypothetical protein Syun_017379 [Stephania yunnanensis]|uniref:Thaumatin-like protein n=1 Tax=Stephania yunnanensis TaxID=152371 RepID=A0AAP0J957_9MAGN